MKHSVLYLRGISQIFLLSNPVIGLMMVITLALFSSNLLLGCLLGALVGVITASLVELDKNKIDLGLFGYNPALLGMAILTFYEISLTVCIVIVLASIFTTLITSKISTLLGPKIPPYTSPYLLTAWLVILCSPYLNLIPVSTITHVQAITIEPFTPIKGLGQVLFLDSVFASLLCLIALAIHSFRMAIWAVFASALSLVFALGLGFDPVAIEQGMYSYNAVLVCIVLVEKCKSKLVIITIGTCLSVLITHAFSFLNLPALTAPFVLSVWIIYWLKMLYRPIFPQFTL